MFLYINLLNLLYFYITLHPNIAQQNTRYEQRGEKNRKLSDSAPRHNIEPVTGSDDEVVQPARNRTHMLVCRIIQYTTPRPDSTLFGVFVYATRCTKECTPLQIQNSIKIMVRWFELHRPVLFPGLRGCVELLPNEFTLELFVESCEGVVLLVVDNVAV